jgi:membrane-associated phospholipid phosphatase
LLFGRARPRLWLRGEPGGFFHWHWSSDYQSFPSGHTATSVAAAVILGTLLPRWRRGFTAFAVLIAASRLVLDAHFLSDVLAGAMVGYLSARFALEWRNPRPDRGQSAGSRLGASG